MYSDEYLKYDFGGAHVLRKDRVPLARMLMKAYGLIGPGGAIESKPGSAEYEDLIAVHDRGYLEVLEHLSEHPDGQSYSHGLGISDNPVFRGMYEAASIQAGGTALACDVVASSDATRAMNAGGGFHHAMPARASGFCLINDIAVGIKRLLSRHRIRRVLYVDIDVHHGDGVEEIFAEEPRVLKASLHEDGNYLFPGTGSMDDIGRGEGEGYSVNVPLPPYTGDASYLHAFREIVLPLAERFKPEILFTQLGADTHYADPLAHLRLTTRSHEEMAKSFDDISNRYCGGRWVAVTGGGYDIMTCPRVWTLFFGRMVGKELDNNLPTEWMEHCRITQAAVPEGGTLRDSSGSIEDGGVSRAVQKVVEGVRKSIFKYHGLG